MTSFYREKADPKFCIPESYQKQPEEKEEKEDEINLEWLEGAAILFAVVLVVVITAFNDWTKGPGSHLPDSHLPEPDRSGRPGLSEGTGRMINPEKRKTISWSSGKN